MARTFLTDEMWDKLAPLLPPERGGMGRPHQPHRPWIEAILWKHRTGAPACLVIWLRLLIQPGPDRITNPGMAPRSPEFLSPLIPGYPLYPR
jgi:transposase